MENKELIKIALGWLKRNADSYTWYNEMEGESGMKDDFYDDFTKAMNTYITLQEYCNKLNQYLPCKSQEDIDNISNILNEVFSTVKGSKLYWSREIFLDTGGDTDKCTLILIHRECKFIPIDDIEEHLGIEVIYKYETEVL